MVTGLINNGFICTKNTYEADHNHNDDDVWIFGLKEIKKRHEYIQEETESENVRQICIYMYGNRRARVYDTLEAWQGFCGITYTIWFDYFLDDCDFINLTMGWKTIIVCSTQSQINILTLLKIYLRCTQWLCAFCIYIKLFVYVRITIYI